MKRWWTSLIIKRIQIKITARLSPQAIRMAITKRTEKNKSWQRYREIGTGSFSTVYGSLNGAATMKYSIKVPQKIENRTTIWSYIPILGYLSKRTEIRISKKYLHSSVHYSIYHKSQEVAPTYQTNEWMILDTST